MGKEPRGCSQARDTRGNDFLTDERYVAPEVEIAQTVEDKSKKKHHGDEANIMQIVGVANREEKK